MPDWGSRSIGLLQGAGLHRLKLGEAGIRKLVILISKTHSEKHGQTQCSLNSINKLKQKKYISSSEICVENFKVPLRMVQVWTGFKWVSANTTYAVTRGHSQVV